ncbi:hypothetical protein [Methylobacterium sp. AMS5]|uniref:hypothetical protein n=1 Tax=Methylobacterium sp. AMS5 TaxID=925818 RepID=UPI00074F87F0|nr:hypothetical protein [Methylobacterium sp. AMS5]AMB48355.1 cobyrinic acid a,c-diamide synthase [Methylobacterium sp. AMS5]
MSLKGDMNALARQKKREGWTIEKTKKNHLRWTYVLTGCFIITSATPSDHRNLANVKAQLKRCEKPLH